MKHANIKIILTSFVGMSLMLSMSGCATKVDTKTPETLSLNTTVDLKEFPSFAATTKSMPKGWGVKETTDTVTGAQSIKGQISPEYISVYNEDDSCTFTANIYSDSSYKINHGDEYNSKNLLYPKNLTMNTVMNDEKNITLPSKSHKIEAVSGQYVNDTYDENGNVNGVTYNIAAVRAFSVILPNNYVPFVNGPTILEDGTVSTEVSSIPVPTNDEYGYALNEGLPVIDYTLSCSTKESASQDDWDALVKSVKLTLNVTDKK